MWVKIIIMAMLAFMVFNLFRAMRVMMRGETNGEPMSKFIGRRVLTSAAIVAFILIAIAFGWITPNPRPY